MPRRCDTSCQRAPDRPGPRPPWSTALIQKGRSWPFGGGLLAVPTQTPTVTALRQQLFDFLKLAADQFDVSERVIGLFFGARQVMHGTLSPSKDLLKTVPDLSQPPATGQDC
ncbi:Hypothetical protein SRM_00210 [Salinibacter ruber M8]|uniref:Uncharacterized protein n=1 Tax=Salinibacter ruber (strain M8) TaxID=761659 RepID=D5H526_SALRM|nr:Hypothetical protein SRM_00210 [Salinibacter ruber M8]